MASTKTQPLPFNPASPNVHVVNDALAAALRAASLGKLDAVVDSVLPIPGPQSLLWGGNAFDCEDTTWTMESGVLELELRRPTIRPDEKLDKMFRVMNLPASFHLEGDRELSARLAHLTSQRNSVDLVHQRATTTYTLMLDSWIWLPPSNSCLWVGRLHGVPRIDDGNLAVCAGGGSSGYHLLLAGKYDLSIIQRREDRASILVVDTHGEVLDQEKLSTDFMAMEFALGRPLRLDHLAAVEDAQVVVGAAGLGLGPPIEKARGGRCPVAASMDLYANYDQLDAEHLYVPVIFSLVDQALRSEGPDGTLLTAVAAYLDAVTAANIHVSYLLTQVALEALGSAMVQATSGVLVAEPVAWLKFVASHKAEIRAFARNDEAAGKLVAKVENAQQAPSTDRVAAALRHCGLDLPKPALEEIRLRNPSAHNYVMAKESTADAQNLADRLATVQTLLVALIAKHVGFRGPIVGWEWIRGRHKIPDWWPWEPLPEAKQRYLVLPETGAGS
jgi:hypothetical protein